jgi:hypothetical protein
MYEGLLSYAQENIPYFDEKNNPFRRYEVMSTQRKTLTNRAMQHQLGVDQPDYGFLLDTMVVPSRGTLERLMKGIG